MSEWLLEHILHHDVMIGKWIKAHNKNLKCKKCQQTLFYFKNPI